jgi:hypothetical protein
MQRGKGRRCNANRGALAVPVAVLLVACACGGCSTTVETPFPDIKPVSSTSLSQEQQKKAVEELNKARATHERDAEQQIEQSR